MTDVGHRALLVGQSTVEGLGQVSLVLVEDLTDRERTLFVTRPADEAALWERVELALSQSPDADSVRLPIMLNLLRRTRPAAGLAETAVFDRWFYVTGFLRQVLALGFARVVLKAKRNLRYGYQGQEQTIDQLARQIPAKRYRTKTHRGQRVQLATLRVHNGTSLARCSAANYGRAITANAVASSWCLRSARTGGAQPHRAEVRPAVY